MGIRNISSIKIKREDQKTQKNKKGKPSEDVIYDLINKKMGTLSEERYDINTYTVSEKWTYTRFIKKIIKSFDSLNKYDYNKIDFACCEKKNKNIESVFYDINDEYYMGVRVTRIKEKEIEDIHNITFELYDKSKDTRTFVKQEFNPNDYGYTSNNMGFRINSENKPMEILQSGINDLIKNLDSKRLLNKQDDIINTIRTSNNI